MLMSLRATTLLTLFAIQAAIAFPLDPETERAARAAIHDRKTEFTHKAFCDAIDAADEEKVLLFLKAGIDPRLKESPLSEPCRTWPRDIAVGKFPAIITLIDSYISRWDAHFSLTSISATTDSGRIKHHHPQAACVRGQIWSESVYTIAMRNDGWRGFANFAFCPPAEVKARRESASVGVRN